MTATTSQVGAGVGVNVAGFLHASNGLGDAGRQLVTSLRAAGVDVVEVDFDATDAARVRDVARMSERLHDVTIAVVTAFELEAFRAACPELFANGRKVIGYWFWELSEVPASHHLASRLLDEVWTPTQFVFDAYRAVLPATTPVRLAPLRLPLVESDPPAVRPWRQAWGDRFTFLTVLNYLSVPERKNPRAAIQAFQEAFPRHRTDVQLVVKAQNVEFRMRDAAALRRLVGGDERVVFEERHLDDRSHQGLVEAADCLVSTHRSEGLGLVPALAMSLDTAVIATAYGGNVDYSDDQNCLLVDFDLVPVTNGEGVYPDGATWAEISRPGLVDAMRRVEDDVALRTALVSSGRSTIFEQPSEADVGASYAALLGSGQSSQ